MAVLLGLLDLPDELLIEVLNNLSVHDFFRIRLVNLRLRRVAGDWTFIKKKIKESAYRESQIDLPCDKLNNIREFLLGENGISLLNVSTFDRFGMVRIYANPEFQAIFWEYFRKYNQYFGSDLSAYFVEEKADAFTEIMLSLYWVRTEKETIDLFEYHSFYHAVKKNKIDKVLSRLDSIGKSWLCQIGGVLDVRDIFFDSSKAIVLDVLPKKSLTLFYPVEYVLMKALEFQHTDLFIKVYEKYYPGNFDFKCLGVEYALSKNNDQSPTRIAQYKEVSFFNYCMKYGSSQLFDYMLNMNPALIRETFDHYVRSRFPYVNEIYPINLSKEYQNERYPIQNRLMLYLSDTDLDHLIGVNFGSGRVHNSARFLEKHIETKLSILINRGADVNERTTMGRTPLMLACIYSSSVDVVKLLLENGAQVDLQDDFGNTALHYVVSDKSISSRIANTLLKYLIKDLNEVEKLYLFNMKNKKGKVALHLANLDKAPAKTLLEGGALVNVFDHERLTPLHQSVFYNRECCLDYLIEKGADKDARNVYGETIFHYFLKVSSRITFKNISKFINIFKYEVNAVTLKKETLLHYAVRYLKKKAFNHYIRCMIESGYEDSLKKQANMHNIEGETPLHFVAHTYIEMFERFIKLIEIGSRPDIQNDHGDTPIDLIKDQRIRYKLLGWLQKNDSNYSIESRQSEKRPYDDMESALPVAKRQRTK